MKRFLIFVVCAVVVLSLGVTAYYFIKSDEVLYAKEDVINVNRLQEFELQYVHENAKSEVVMDSMNSDILLPTTTKYNFRAVGAGRAYIKISTSSNSVDPIYVEVNVGDGSNTCPYFINNVEQFASIGNNVEGYEEFTLNKSYVLTVSIDLASYNDNKWIPIGKDDANGFAKSFDFAGHTISGMKIESDETIGNNAGLFSKIASTGVIKNLKINNCTIYGNYTNAGLVAGESNGYIERVTITNCSVESTYNNSKVGGVVGMLATISGNSTAKIERISFSSKVQGNYMVGGIAGQNYGGTIINCYAIGNSSTKSVRTLSATTIIGGLVGDNSNFDSGLINYRANIKDCYSAILISVPTNYTSEYCGAIIGKNTQKSTDKYNKIFGAYYCSELNGIDTITAVGNEADVDITGVSQPKRVALEKTQNNFKTGSVSDFYSNTNIDNEVRTWLFDAVWLKNANQNDGFPYLNMSGASVNDELYEIADGSTVVNATTLSNIRENLTGTYVITSNIVLTDEWIPIGTEETPFEGKLIVESDSNGDKYTISGLKITNMQRFGGLFGVIGKSGVVDGVTIINPNIKNAVYAGAVAAKNYGIISNCEVKNTDTQSLSEAYLYDSANDQMTSRNTLGGIAGTNDGSISNCKNTGVVMSSVLTSENVTVDSMSLVGGITGVNDGQILSCISNPYIHGEMGYTAVLGGVTGSLGGTISSCKFDGVIKSLATGSTSYAGGIVGLSTNQNSIAVEKCYTKGTIVSGYAGGIFGTGRIYVRLCQTDSTITGLYVGGLGSRFISGLVEDCHVKASLYGASGNAIKGGFYYQATEVTKKMEEKDRAYSYRLISQCYFDNEGKNFWETKSNIRQKRDIGGYITSIFDSVYEKVEGVSAKSNNVIIKFFFWEKDTGLTHLQIIGNGTSDFEIFDTFGFNHNGIFWQFTNGSSPQLFAVKSILN